MLKLADLFGAVKVRLDRIEAILETLLAAGWIARAAPRGWVLSRDADTIQVYEVFRRFAFSPGLHAPAREADAALEALAVTVANGAAERLSMSLDALYRDAEQRPAEEPVSG